MAIARDSGGQIAVFGAASYSSVLNNVAGTMLVVTLNDQTNVGASHVASVAYAGTVMTHTLTASGISGNGALDIYTLPNPATGSNNLVISCTSTTAYHGFAESYTGTTSTDTSGSASTMGATSLTVNLSLANTNEWGVGLAYLNNGSSILGSTNISNVLWQNSLFQTFNDSASAIAGSGSTNFVWTMVQASALGAVVALKPTAAGAAAVPELPILGAG